MKDQVIKFDHIPEYKITSNSHKTSSIPLQKPVSNWYGWFSGLHRDYNDSVASFKSVGLVHHKYIE